MSAQQIASALRGKRHGNGWLVSCPCPNHGSGRGDRNPSLSIMDGEGGRLLLKCFAGCEFEDILDELRGRGLVSNDNRNDAHVHRLPVTPAKPRWHLPDAEVRAILKSCRPPHGTRVQEYLERRGILIMPSTLRYSEYEHRPAMVAVVQRPDGVEIAVQRTFLRACGEKASPKKLTTGNLGTGAVRLGYAAEVMGIAEGVETALSARFMTEIPVWASLGASRLHQVELPNIVREVHVFADNDDAGRKAAEMARAAHEALGREVQIHFPRNGAKDFNDAINEDADGWAFNHD